MSLSATAGESEAGKACILEAQMSVIHDWEVFASISTSRMKPTTQKLADRFKDLMV